MTTTASAPSKGSATLRRGSTFSDRQIAQSVKDGKAVKVTLPDGDVLTGWIYGVDDYHWGLVDMDGTTHLIHKTVPCLSIVEYRLSDVHEDSREMVEALVGPFRRYVMKHHFNDASFT